MRTASFYSNRSKKVEMSRRHIIDKLQSCNHFNLTENISHNKTTRLLYYVTNGYQSTGHHMKTLKKKSTLDYSCKIEYFVETLLCKLRVILVIARITGCASSLRTEVGDSL